MSNLNDYIDLAVAGLRIARANRDVWTEAKDAQRRKWFDRALDESFSGRYYTPENALFKLVQSVSPTTQNIEQFWILNPWARDLFDERKTVWDETVKSSGNPAFWKHLGYYILIGIMIAIPSYFIIKKYRKK